MSPVDFPAHETLSALPLDAERIEQELAAIWRDSFQSDDNEVTGLKISLANLVVISSAEHQHDSDRLIATYASRKPSRAIQVILDDAMSEPPHAHISASCNLQEGMSKKLCWEKIILSAKPEHLRQVVGLIRSLRSRGDIPLLLVDLYDIKGEIDLRRKLYRMADFVFVDGHGRFRTLLPPPGLFDDSAIYGFEWVSIDVLREAVRSFFDRPQNLRLLERLQTITISYNGPNARNATSPALLLAGWIVSSLEMEIETSHDRRIRASCYGRTVEIVFQALDQTPPDVKKVEFFFDGHSKPAVFSQTDGRAQVIFGNYKTTCEPAKPFDRVIFVIEQSGKDRRRSSYAASYRAALKIYNSLMGIAGRRSMIVVEDYDRLAKVASRLFYSLAIRTLAYRGAFYVSLAGGSTPKAIYQEIAQSAYAEMVDWSQVYFFFGDERPVPPDHDESNYRLARDYLFNQLQIADDHIFRIEGENPNKNEVCRAYAETIRSMVQTASNGIPRFDLIFLGVGPDGHTASLFPEVDYDSLDPDLLIIHKYVQKLDQHRISMNYRLINNAEHIFMVTGGEAKADALYGIFHPENDVLLPAARIDPVDGSLLWMIDSAASARLAGTTLPIEVSRW